MSKFIEELFKNEVFLKFFFNYEENYVGSDYEANMYHFLELNDVKYNFIIKNTEWIYIDDKGNLYGILKDFVIKLDDEGELEYFCHGFQNIPAIIIADYDTPHKQKLINRLNKLGLVFEQIYSEYVQFCKSFSLDVFSNYNETDFNQFLKDNVK